MPLPPFIARRVAMRRCVNTVMQAAHELQQQRRSTPASIRASTDAAVAAMAEASRLLIEQQQDNERQHYELVSTATAHKRKFSALDEYASELVRPGSAVKRTAQAQQRAAGRGNAGRRRGISAAK